MKRWLSNRIRKAAGGYGITLVVILMITTLITTVSIQMMLSGASLPGMQNAIRNSTMAKSVAESAFPAVRNQIQTLLNSGTAVNVGYQWSSYIYTPNDPSSLVGATSATGNYTATVTKKGADYFLISVTATVDGVQDTEVQAVTIKPTAKNVRFMGRANGDQAGRIANVGDVDGDGYSDLVIGAANADGGGADSGEVYLIFGRSSVQWNNLTDSNGKFNLSSINGVNTGDNNTIRFIGRVAGDNIGGYIAGGDYNGDGYDDILISATGGQAHGIITGEAYIIFGRSRTNWNALTDSSGNFSLSNINGVNTGDNNTIRLIGEATWDLLYNMSSAGDVNGDGYTDLLMGAQWADGNGLSNSGKTYLIFGRSTSSWNSLTDASGNFELSGVNGVAAGDNNTICFGGRRTDDNLNGLSAVGDVNGDGYDDFMIGAHRAFAPSPDSTKGEAYLIFGRPMTGTGSWQSLITDVNGDFNVATGNGVAVGDNNIIRFIGRTAADNTGAYVPGIGDVNGDGYNDFIIGACSADSVSGNAYLIFGRPLSGTGSWQSLISAASGDFDLSAANVNGVAGGDNNIIRFIGAAANDQITNQFSVGPLGDIDGDGYDDFTIGAIGSDSNGTDSGAAYLIFGRSSAQ